jgi:molecular chaperone HtpG
VGAPGSGQAFQVDLHGVVDLLARHLYSGPRVYLRELLQNGVDAITARHALEPGAPATVRLRTGGDGVLEVVDSGIGLTLDEARELLATIGRSSKRDLDLGLGREEFLGQFGIGLLSAFMVADEIELVSRSARPGGAAPVRWRGFSDGRYELDELAPDAEVPVGSTVRLRPRRDQEHWLAHETVVALAKDFGSLLPVDVAVEVPLEGASAWLRVSEPELPWRRTYADPDERTAALARYCEAALGFTPLAHIDLAVPLAGVSGVAFVLPAAVPPTGSGTHRAYLKRMLLGPRVEGLLPEWAFFVRCVLDASALRPTASREQLYADEVLLATRDALGDVVRSWTLATLAEQTPLARAFVEAHHLAVRALATSDDAMLDLVADVLPYETTDGLLTLAEVHDAHGDVLYAPTVEEFRRIAPVARAQGLGVVNAGYVYDADLLARLATRRPTWRVRPLGAQDVDQVLATLPPVRELELMPLVRAADAVLAPHDCELALRTFEPTDLPAMLLHDREGDHQRDLSRTVSAAQDLWGEVLAGFAAPAPSRQLVLNCANPLVEDLLAAPAGAVRDAGLESLYVSALLLAGEPLRARDVATMNASLTVLLRAGLRGAGAAQDVGDADAPAPPV